MKLSNFKITNKGLYWGLIATFALLYVFVGFVSTLHSITFFNLANTMSLAILLGVTYEIGQASVLFSILMSEKNKNRFLPWALMFLLTALQVTANVYASYKFMATSGSTDWQYWQKTILIGVQAENSEMYQIIISWIAGALLPIVALGMTALVAQNMSFLAEENESSEVKVGSVSDEEVGKIIENEVDKRMANLIDTAKITNTETSHELDKNNLDYLDEEAEAMLNLQPDKLKPDSKVVKKKLGRPPKKKDAVASKKAKELLPRENVEVPQKENTFVNPLEIPSSPILPVKDLEEVFKPSKGDEVIALIEKEEKEKIKESINESIKGIQTNQDNILVPPDILIPFIEGGVEVIDAKAVPKPEEKKT